MLKKWYFDIVPLRAKYMLVNLMRDKRHMEEEAANYFSKGGIRREEGSIQASSIRMQGGHVCRERLGRGARATR